MASIQTLRIRNLVIIEDLTVEFGPGLNLLTGETGAGKSILVDAIGLVAGHRADRGLVRAGAAKATVEALFEIPPDSAAAAWLASGGVAELDEGQLVVRREVVAEGGGRVSLNGSPCTLGLLRELAEHLLELHGQHDPKRLFEATRHLELLDAFGAHAVEKHRVRLAFDALAAARAELETLEERDAHRAERTEDLRRTVREIDSLEPRVGELDELERECRLLRDSGRTAALLDRVVALSYDGEPAAAELAAAAAGSAEALAELDPSLAEPARRLRSAALDLEDAGQTFRDYRDRADFDPARLEQIESRKAALERACLRRATDEAGLVELRDRAEEELRGLQSLEAELALAAARVGETRQEYARAAAALTRARRAAAKKLETAVERQFQALALVKARFRVELPAARGATIDVEGKRVVVAPHGAERAEFLLAANPGEPLRALREVASGGELSRVMLALHVVAGADGGGRVLIFDEVDAGVGGAVADAVGARLRRLASEHQLLCVTHLPQVAVYADSHFRVSKRVSDGRTHAGIAGLSVDERVEELARMLGGKKPTAASRQHATEMLRAANRAPRGVSRSPA